MSAVELLNQALDLHRQGNLDQALILYSKVIEIDPEHTDALNLVGCLYSQLGDHSKGESFLRRALRNSPESSLIWLNLAAIQRESRKLSESLESLFKAIECDPDNSQARDLMCANFLALGRIRESIEAGELAVKLTPRNASCWNNLGTAYYRGKKLDEAESCFLRAQELNPQLVGLLGNLGACYTDMGQLKKAFIFLKEATIREPMIAANWSNLGSLMRLFGDGLGAVELTEKALSISPNDPSILNNYGLALDAALRTEDSKEVFRALLKDEPDMLAARMNYAARLVDLGMFEEAGQSYDLIIGDHPTMGEAYRLRGLLGKWKPQDSLIVKMQNLADDPQIDDHERIHLNFALGKAFSDLGNVESSMNRYILANKAVRKNLKYSHESQRKLFEDIKQVFDESRMKSLEESGHKSRVPIFILGMPRSGSSLIEQILASHPSVHGSGERNDLGYLLYGPETPFTFPGDFGRESTKAIDFSSLGEWYVRRIASGMEDGKYITDKMPHNFLYIGLIHLILPNALIIHCKRSPKDTCFSCYKNYFSEHHPYSYDQQELGLYYKLYEDLMSHWHRILPGRIFDLRYEEVIEDPESQVRNLLDYCSLNWDDQCLKFYETTRVVGTMSSSQVRQPIYKDSVQRWRKFESYLHPLFSLFPD